MIFKSTVKDMIEAQTGEKCEVRIKDANSNSILKAVQVRHNGTGLDFFKEHTNAKTKEVTNFPQGGVKTVGMDDEISFDLTKKSWFYHGNGNVVVTIK